MTTLPVVLELLADYLNEEELWRVSLCKWIDAVNFEDPSTINDAPRWRECGSRLKAIYQALEKEYRLRKCLLEYAQILEDRNGDDQPS